MDSYGFAVERSEAEEVWKSNYHSLASCEPEARELMDEKYNIDNIDCGGENNE